MKQLYWAKTALFTIAILFFSNDSFGQTSKEFGVRFTNVNSFDLMYKFGKDEDRLTRIRLIGGEFNTSNSESNGYTSFGIGLGIGREKHVQIDDRFDFIHGIDGSVRYSSRESESLSSPLPRISDETFLRFSIGYLIGATYNVSEKISAGAEVILSVSYTNRFIENTIDMENITERSDIFSAQVSNGGAALTLTYKFQKN